MSTPTDLQEVYDSFFAKTDNEDFAGKEDLVFQYFKAANAYAYKTVPEDLTYIADQNYEGTYIGTLNQDSIELIALYMKREHIRRNVSRFEKLKKYPSSKNFGGIDFTNEYKAALLGKKEIEDEIRSFKQEFNTYSN